MLFVKIYFSVNVCEIIMFIYYKSTGGKKWLTVVGILWNNATQGKKWSCDIKLLTV